MAIPDSPSTELVFADEIGMDRLQRRPIIERIDHRQLELIRKTIAVAEGEHAITNAELGHFLELCALYGLDPFAREAWIAKSKTGKLLIMVGRDGLRKIADRNGLRVQGDVIHAKDEFASSFIDSPDDAKPGEWESHGCAPFHRIHHVKRGIGATRGAVAGAWSRVSDRRTRVEAGYFDAPITEYKPANVSVYSPWSKQESAMMRAAVDRQAIREATPLGGLLAQGEDESADTARTVLGAGQGSGEGPGWGDMAPETMRVVMNVIERAKALGHAGLSDVATIQQRLKGQHPDVVAQWIEDQAFALDAMEPPEAEVVTGEAEQPAAPADEFSLNFGGEVFAFRDSDDPYDMIAVALSGGMNGAEAMHFTANDLRASADGFEGDGDMAEATRYRAMADALDREADEQGQTTLDVD